MNVKLISKYLGRILLLVGLFMIPALLIAVFCGESESAYSFIVTIAVMVAAGLLMNLPKTRDTSIYAREGFVTVALAWVLISLFGAIPLCLSGAIPNYLDAVFETVSGFTTTGATVLKNVEALPASMLYWRSFTHWLGGMGVLVFVLAISPLGSGSGMPLRLLRAESPGPTVGKLAPKLHRTARILYAIYITMTLLEIIMLLIGKMPLFDAVTTAFGTAGTGGFSIRNASMAAYDSHYLQTVVGVFMLLFGVNFNIYYLILIGDFRSVFKNGELRLYAGIVFASVAAITVNILSIYGSVRESLHQAFFQVSSIITTTGFATVDFNMWPEFSHVLLMILMVLGACAGSTGGGLKISRLLIMLKSLRNEIKRMIHPHSVTAVKLDGKPLDSDTVRSVNVFFFTYITVIALSTLLIALEGQTFKTNFTAVLACINNIGPGMDAVGPVLNFSVFGIGSKLVLMMNMLLGRLEIFPILLLFAPATWRLKK